MAEACEWLLELAHITDLMEARKEERDKVIRELVAIGISCRTIADHTNMSYTSVFNNFYPKGGVT
jgi:hypothetical protein